MYAKKPPATTKSSTSSSSSRPKLQSDMKPSIASSSTSVKISTARYDAAPLAGGFGSKVSGKTPFSIAYSNSTIPCRLVTGTAKMSLTWQIAFDDIDYSIILPLCLEGLNEVSHPYLPVAKMATRDLLSAECASVKLPPLLLTVAQKLREVLVSSSRGLPETFVHCLDLIILVSQKVGEQLTPHITPFLGPIGSQMLKSTSSTPSTVVALRGGPVDVKGKCIECL